MSITRRTALATGAAAITTAAIAAPLAIKAAGVKAALGSDPVLPAYEAFEAARLKYIAMSDHVDAVDKEVEAELPPKPHRGRNYRELSPAEVAEHHEWNTLHFRRVTARLGMDEDDFSDVYQDRMELAYEALAGIQATTVAGLLCQVRAWWNARQTVRDTEVPKPEGSSYDPEVFVQRLYHDVARLAGGLPS